MKKSILFSLLCLLPAALLGFQPEGFKELSIGDPAPDFSLPGTDGKTYQLSDFNESDVFMVYFTGTHCPTSHGVESRLQTLVADMKEKSFSIVAINPNHNDGLRPDEFSYSKYDESFADSKRYAEDLGWTFPFLYDGEKQITAREYGCLATPHIFVFDKERKLQYTGRYDDSRFKDPATVKSPDVRNAIEALFAGKPVPTPVTKPFGCSTKWREKKELVLVDDKKWANTKAVIHEIDGEGIKGLRKNGTKKVRLFNVWSTSCEPCKEEMPDLSKIVRKYSRRNFELVTISMDDPSDKELAEKFLGQNGIITGAKLAKSLKAEKRKTNNYLYTGASIDDLTAALDSEWSGATPYTVLVDTAGEVLYRKTGLIDPKELDQEILKELTEYWDPPKK